MTPFTTLTSVAAPFPESDVDTDIIFPARFLLRTDRQNLGACAFHDRRFDADGHERPDFVLHRAPWRGARILVAGSNFGCGSSREQAPWSLADLGLRCIIAPSFGDIFQANCWTNGILPLPLGGADHARLLREAADARPVTVDLRRCTIELADDSLRFEVPQRRRQALLAGLDEIELMLRDAADKLPAYEQARRNLLPWLFDAPAPPGSGGRA